MPDKLDLRHKIEEWIHENYEIDSDEHQSVRSVALLGAEDVIDNLEVWIRRGND